MAEAFKSPRVHVVTSETGNLDSPSVKATSVDDICLTPGCVHAASKMLEQMDDSVEPCDDFYNFACGTFSHFISLF